MDTTKEGPKFVHSAAGQNVTRIEGDETIGLDGSRTWNLPSGSVAVCRRGNGDTILRAQRMVGNESIQRDPILMVFALIACKCTIDGKELTLEQVRQDLSDIDVLDLMKRVQLGKSSPPTILPP